MKQKTIDYNEVCFDKRNGVQSLSHDQLPP